MTGVENSGLARLLAGESAALECEVDDDVESWVETSDGGTGRGVVSSEGGCIV